MTSLADEEDSITPNPLDSVPPLTTGVLTDETEKVPALKLIADSIAQQRQLASRAILFHPITIAAYIGLLAVTTQLLYKTRADLGVLFTTVAGVTMACLVGVRSATAGYITLAEDMSWKYLQNEDGSEDIIIGSRYGEDVIGALILRLERGCQSPSKRKAKNKSGGKGVVRAWTTKMRYRGTGIGTDLLQEAVRVTREKLGNSAEIGFAAEHANSKMVLPETFNSGFRQRERKAAKALETIVEGDFGGKRKR